jgi:alkanesulfonate monooxygenase SsuD/methylene tetrahydromethanopterin reductase-like flavin-dependent oxidoreductase (luciferase family)
VRVSFQLLPEQPAPELLDAIVAADELGYYGCYSADEIYHKDAWLLFAAAAQRTERIRIGPCVAPIYMREPTYVAQLAATLDELSDGRAEVVFGIGNMAMLEQYGVKWRGTRPIARLREAHHVMRTLLADGAIDFEGDFYRYSGVTTSSRPVQEHLPLKIGAMGVAPINEAFAAGDVQRALEATPEDVADRIMVAGTPEDWVRWLTETYAPAGLNHALVSFTDPFMLGAWAGITVEGLPDLGAQVRLFGAHVLPEISSL